MKQAITLAVLLGCATGCSGNDTSCTTSTDCFRGEACVDGACQALDGSNGTPNGTPNGTQNGSPNGTPNGATNGTPNNDTSTGLCRVDPFTSMCPADDNDSFGDYITMESGRGCLGGGDDFEGGEVELLDQTLCPLEAADKYSTNLLPCDNFVAVVEVIVTPHEQCDPDDWHLNVALQGNDCIEGNDKMRCETLADGSKKATGLMEPSISIASPYITVTPIAPNLRFDYDVKIVVRE